MAGITLEKGKQIYLYGQPMTALHLIVSGKIQVAYPGGSYTLSKGDVIGICETCSEVHLLNYVALDDVSILTYPLNNFDSLENLLNQHSDLARLFLLSLFKQINILLGRSSISEMNCSNLYHNLKEDYEKYNTLCRRYRIPARILEDIEDNAYLGDEAADTWLNDYYIGFTHLYSSDYYKNLVQEPSVSLGMIRKGSLDFRRTYLSHEEQFRYMQNLFTYYFNESGDDLFDFYTSLYYKLEAGSPDAKDVLSVINRMIHQFKELAGPETQQFNNRIHSFQSNIAKQKAMETVGTEGASNASVLSELTDSLNTILNYAEADPELATSFRQHVNTYKNMSERSALDDSATRIRRALTSEFYQLYIKLFLQTLEETTVPMPVWMFLYFGYVDEELAGSDNAVTLYSLAKSINSTRDLGVYIFYDWLLAIYEGKKEPSRDEFDQDYSDYIHKQKISGAITDAQMRKLEQDALNKVKFELQNMFPQVNKMTFGRISTFCPLFSSENVLKGLEDSFVTATKICKVIEQIKKVDYTAFYRESMDMEHLDVMGKEPIHLEFLPDVILMPNVGIRGAMWQEIEGKRRNSPSRMILSIFHLEDLLTTFIHLTGEYRWELCKRVQGARWNDISEFSLTSEYFDYVQFYRKNRDLTPEAKEKVRASLQRAKNSFKEMFVRDYIIWIMFEGNGSPRLNKVARKILFTYCPFPADICDSLTPNPLYTEILSRHNVLKAQKLHHLDMVIQKAKNGKGSVPKSLEREIAYVEGKPSLQ